VVDPRDSAPMRHSSALVDGAARAVALDRVGVRTVFHVVLDRLAGGQPWLSDWMRELYRVYPPFFTHLLEQPAPYLHYLGLVRSLLDGARSSVALDAAFARRLCDSRKRELLAELVGHRTRGLTKALRRLRSRGWEMDDYRRLVALLDDALAGTTLRHAKRITPSLLKTLANLPPAMRGAPYLQRVHSYTASADLRQAIKETLAAVPEHAQALAQREFGAVATEKQFDKWTSRWLFRAKLPEPPWPGTSTIVPIRSGHELDWASKRFRNCLRDYLTDIAAGQYCCYVSTAPPAVILIARLAFSRWKIGGILGPGNAWLPKAQRGDLVAVLLKAGFELDESDEARRNHRLMA